MKRIKFFSTYTHSGQNQKAADDLTKNLNDWLAENKEKVRVDDIDWESRSGDQSSFHLTVCVHYEERTELS